MQSKLTRTTERGNAVKAKVRTVTIHDARYHRLLGPGPITKTIEEIAQEIVERENAKLKARKGQSA